MRRAKYNTLTPQEEAKRIRENAIKCAQYFQKVGKALVKEKVKKMDFQRMSTEEINKWIEIVSESLGIRQFKK